VGEAESRRDDLKVGDIAVGFRGWPAFCCADDQRLDAPLTVVPRRGLTGSRG
jgi:hypothetical protein